jgi:serine/threonine protein kinase
MGIRVRCPNPACGKQYDLKDELAGKAVKCSACQQTFRVPAPPVGDGAPRDRGPTGDATSSALNLAFDTSQAARPGPSDAAPSALPLAFDTSKIEKQAAPADPLIGAKIAHYRIESQLGRGGMGKVYKARNINLNKTCAIKILPPEFATQDRSLVDRFIREARSAAAVEHPNVLPVQFVGKVEENYFIGLSA